MSNVQEAYQQWSQQYDTNNNRTRDVEAVALQTLLQNIHPSSILEAGCGTGKNTAFLASKAADVLAVDLTEAMLQKAKAKTAQSNVIFLQANLLQPWTFTHQQFDLITFSLVLEHIENLDVVFAQAAQKLRPGGYIYVGELHPFKQYAGTKARFDGADGSRTIVDCFNHHVSDFVLAAQKQGLKLNDLQEFFDEDDRTNIPRILGLLFSK